MRLFSRQPKKRYHSIAHWLQDHPWPQPEVSSAIKRLSFADRYQPRVLAIEVFKALSARRSAKA